MHIQNSDIYMVVVSVLGITHLNFNYFDIYAHVKPKVISVFKDYNIVISYDIMYLSFKTSLT